MRHTDEEIEQAAERFEKQADSLDPSAAPVEPTDDLRAIASSADAVEAGERHLKATIDVARSNGRSWNQIALALGVSRQAARQRFAEKTRA